FGQDPRGIDDLCLLCAGNHFTVSGIGPPVPRFAPLFGRKRKGCARGSRGVVRMTKRRVLFVDGFALGFLAVGGVLACSLLSYESAADGSTADLLGEPGAGLAASLFESLGQGT